MNQSKIIQIRLAAQQLVQPSCLTPKEVVTHMGAIQAQDYAMSKWAVGIRLPGSGNKMVEEALDKGEILRTHVLRPTWHLVAAEDIRWMLELTGPKIISSIRSRDISLGLSEDVFNQTRDIIGKALEGNNHLTRQELVKRFEQQGIPMDNYRSSHVMLRAELEGIVCSGISINNQRTYALLSERVPSSKKMSREEALAELTKRYFTSHGLATVDDFCWWSGLTKTETKRGLEMNRTFLIEEKIGTQAYWMAPGVVSDMLESVHLLPAFDEFIISYKDRTDIISPDHHPKAISSNGISKPVLLENGTAIGLWKKVSKGKIIITDHTFFNSKDQLTQSLFEKESLRYKEFLSN